MDSNTLTRMVQDHLLENISSFAQSYYQSFSRWQLTSYMDGVIHELIDYLGLSKRINNKPSELSGGEKQRVAVARALINSPSLILADEPSGNLDSSTSNNLHDLFNELRKDFKYTFVIATHDITLAKKSDRILKISDGIIK